MHAQRVVDLPYALDWPPNSTTRCSRIAAALVSAPFLEEIVIPIPLLITGNFPPFVGTIRGNPSLKTVKIKKPIVWDHNVVDIVNNDPSLKTLVRYSILK